MITYNVSHTLKYDRVKTIISSDGRGYYAFLPSIFLHGSEGGNEKNLIVEQSYYANKLDQIYIARDKKGYSYNRYFPGVAVLQAPFFGMACLFSWIFNYPIDGYSWFFLFFFYIGSLFYSVLGMLLFAKSLKIVFDLTYLKSSLFALLFYLGTPLLFFTVNLLCYSHLYSFFFLDFLHFKS